MAGTFEIFVDKGGKFRFRLRAGNNAVVAAGSEGYASAGDAQRGAEAAQRAADGADIVDLSGS
ncbi:YegP family protein [Fodinicola feengrottensis]|uniref:DUF1508 domain-containing protein n=1 Tax=Fodinicola feengrottensis TaxID=435914 RepID=A0ABN2HNF0_9ACTN|nr:DUF1508 domain-containing protein [Fodinicola feengrottensis]